MIDYKQVKLAGDKLVAFVLLPILLIVLLLIFIPQLVLYGRVFFIQKRPGYKEQIFNLYKFQTMSSGSESDETRITNFGDILRKLGVDELPQIVNILKGEMSFIGPRPLLIEYLVLYNEDHKQRHNVKPGITGLAQISTENIKNWQDKLDFDVKYIENISLLTDLKILIATVKLLFVKAGKEKEFIKEKFDGYER